MGRFTLKKNPSKHEKYLSASIPYYNSDNIIKEHDDNFYLSVPPLNQFSDSSVNDSFNSSSNFSPLPLPLPSPVKTNILSNINKNQQQQKPSLIEEFLKNNPKFNEPVHEIPDNSDLTFILQNQDIKEDKIKKLKKTKSNDTITKKATNRNINTDSNININVNNTITNNTNTTNDNDNIQKYLNNISLDMLNDTIKSTNNTSKSKNSKKFYLKSLKSPTTSGSNSPSPPSNSPFINTNKNTNINNTYSIFYNFYFR